MPQLQEVLQWQQSVGIVGGRPSSSLYFIGHQGPSVLFMDPHEVQDVRSHLSSLVCFAVQQMPCIDWQAPNPQCAYPQGLQGAEILMSWLSCSF